MRELSSITQRLKLKILTIRHQIPARYALILVAGLLLWCFYIWTPPEHPVSVMPLPHAANHTTPREWSRRAEMVKKAFLHAYGGYEEYASPHDELKPVWNTSVDNFNGWGVSIVDSLDTMLLMGLEDEFNRALPIIEKIDFVLRKQVSPGIFSSTLDMYAPFFETVIRYLGGLLSAYALSNELILLQKADELATKLAPVFNTPTGLPVFGVNTVSGKVSGSNIGMLAEIASCQLEYAYLAHLTGKIEHYDRAGKIMDALGKAQIDSIGMLPTRFNLTTGQPSDESTSVGGAADSAHEYLLKYHLLTGKTDKSSLDLYMRTVNHILTNLMFISPNRELLYVTSIQGTSKFPSQTFEHLSCFLPGLLALGLHSLPESAFMTSPYSSLIKNHKLLHNYNLRDLHVWAAEGLGESCWLMYADQPTGLGPDEVYMTAMPDTRSHAKDFHHGGLWIDYLERWRKRGGRRLPPGLGEKLPIVPKDGEPVQGLKLKRDYMIRRPDYLLRPETIESMYILWKTTGNPKWRERGWKVFQAIEREAKTPSGYASLRSVEHSPAHLKDEMPSYFLAETLKYLYLLFLDKDPVRLEDWVFNTEAHPFPIFSWSSMEKLKFRIASHNDV